MSERCHLFWRPRTTPVGVVDRYTYCWPLQAYVFMFLFFGEIVDFFNLIVGQPRSPHPTNIMMLFLWASFFQWWDSIYG